MIETCHTFATDAEAAAFLKGYQLAIAFVENDDISAVNSLISVGIDVEEPNVILADMPEDQEAEWLHAFAQTAAAPVAAPDRGPLRCSVCGCENLICLKCDNQVQ
jgi:hypothetical protein